MGLFHVGPGRPAGRVEEQPWPLRGRETHVCAPACAHGHTHRRAYSPLGQAARLLRVVCGSSAEGVWTCAETQQPTVSGFEIHSGSVLKNLSY